jgi:hypothetical protein
LSDADKRIGQPSQDSKDQAWLEPDKEIGSQEEIETEFKDKVKNTMSQRAKGYKEIEADQRVKN